MLEAVLGLVGPFWVAMAVVALSIWFARRQWSLLEDPRLRRAAQVLVTLTALAVVFVTYRTAADVHGELESSLSPGQPALVVPASNHARSLFVRGHLPDASSGRGASARFAFEIDDEQGESLSKVSGELEEHWGSRRASRKGGKVRYLQRHDETRVDLPSETRGHELQVSLTYLDGDIEPPLDIRVGPSPPSATLTGLGAGLLALAAAFLDSREHRKTAMTLIIGFLGCFTLAFLGQATPHGAASVVVGSSLMGVLGGVAGGFVLRAVVRSLLGSSTEG